MSQRIAVAENLSPEGVSVQSMGYVLICEPFCGDLEILVVEIIVFEQYTISGLCVKIKWLWRKGAVMPHELQTDIDVATKLKVAGIPFRAHESSIDEINNALKTASKNGTQGQGHLNSVNYDIAFQKCAIVPTFRVSPQVESAAPDRQA